MRMTPITQSPVEALLAGLNLGVQRSLDPDPENIVAVATFSFEPLGLGPQQARAPFGMMPQEGIANIEPRIFLQSLLFARSCSRYNRDVHTLAPGRSTRGNTEPMNTSNERDRHSQSV